MSVRFGDSSNHSGRIAVIAETLSWFPLLRVNKEHDFVAKIALIWCVCCWHDRKFGLLSKKKRISGAPHQVGDGQFS
ncbi:hypothetical protein [Duganella callida]|uniref:Uncharacterized protein n=1 Tax=Duganella callida TaxID=2561932 RepID=A0A4Y9SDW8_9BURK|nr:hypothetical protein [Duganella callida]TFW19091.1 hypothetical protein E4L98_16825 [Duganella callida]